MISQYVLQDRTTGTKYALSIDNGILEYTITTDDAQTEPIFVDDIDSSNNWKLYIDNAELVLSSTVVYRDDLIELYDATNGTVWKLVVESGELGYSDTRSNLRPFIEQIKIDEYLHQTLRIQSFTLVDEEHIKDTIDIDFRIGNHVRMDFTIRERPLIEEINIRKN